jgi:hypothetical protein
VGRRVLGVHPDDLLEAPEGLLVPALVPQQDALVGPRLLVLGLQRQDAVGHAHEVIGLAQGLHGGGNQLQYHDAVLLQVSGPLVRPKGLGQVALGGVRLALVHQGLHVPGVQVQDPLAVLDHLGVLLQGLQGLLVEPEHVHLPGPHLEHPGEGLLRQLELVLHQHGLARQDVDLRVIGIKLYRPLQHLEGLSVLLQVGQRPAQEGQYLGVHTAHLQGPAEGPLGPLGLLQSEVDLALGDPQGHVVLAGAQQVVQHLQGVGVVARVHEDLVEEDLGLVMALVEAYRGPQGRGGGVQLPHGLEGAGLPHVGVLVPLVGADDGVGGLHRLVVTAHALQALGPELHRPGVHLLQDQQVIGGGQHAVPVLGGGHRLQPLGHGEPVVVTQRKGVVVGLHRLVGAIQARQGVTQHEPALPVVRVQLHHAVGRPGQGRVVVQVLLDLDDTEPSVLVVHVDLDRRLQRLQGARVVAGGHQGIRPSLVDVGVVGVQGQRPLHQLGGLVVHAHLRLDLGGVHQHVLVHVVLQGLHRPVVGPVGLVPPFQGDQRLRLARDQTGLVRLQVQSLLEGVEGLHQELKSQLGTAQPAVEYRCGGTPGGQGALQRLHQLPVVALVPGQVGLEDPQVPVIPSLVQGQLEGLLCLLHLGPFPVQHRLPPHQVHVGTHHVDEGLHVLEVLGLVLHQGPQVLLGVVLPLQALQGLYAVEPGYRAGRAHVQGPVEHLEGPLVASVLQHEGALGVEGVEVLLVQLQGPVVGLHSGAVVTQGLQLLAEPCVLAAEVGLELFVRIAVLVHVHQDALVLLDRGTVPFLLLVLLGSVHPLLHLVEHALLFIEEVLEAHEKVPWHC